MRHLDSVAKDEVSHHGVAHKHHTTNQAKMDEIWSSQSQRARDHSQTRLEIHTLQHPSNEQQDVDAIQGVVPGQLVHQILQSAIMSWILHVQLSDQLYFKYRPSETFRRLFYTQSVLLSKLPQSLFHSDDQNRLAIGRFIVVLLNDWQQCGALQSQTTYCVPVQHQHLCNPGITCKNDLNAAHHEYDDRDDIDDEHSGAAHRCWLMQHFIGSQTSCMLTRQNSNCMCAKCNIGADHDQVTIIHTFKHTSV